MTRLIFELPEALAKQAEEDGLLEPQEVERIFREEVRRRAGQRLLEIARTPTDEPPMSPEEVQAEIDAYRKEKHQRSNADRP